LPEIPIRARRRCSMRSPAAISGWGTGPALR
jgi:hypothetical protein